MQTPISMSSPPGFLPLLSGSCWVVWHIQWLATGKGEIEWLDQSEILCLGGQLGSDASAAGLCCMCCTSCNLGATGSDGVP